MSNDLRTNRLQEARARAGFTSAAQAAAAFGWSKSTYRSAENGTRELTLDAAETYAKAFRVRPAWLLFGEGLPNRISTSENPKIRMAGIIGAGQEVWPADDYEEMIDASFDGEVAEAFGVKGDSMLPVAREGDTLFFGRSKSPRTLIGKECIVELKDGRRFFKLLRYGPKADLFNLDSYNAPGIEGVEVVRAGELIAIIRR